MVNQEVPDCRVKEDIILINKLLWEVLMVRTNFKLSKPKDQTISKLIHKFIIRLMIPRMSHSLKHRKASTWTSHQWHPTTQLWGSSQTVSIWGLWASVHNRMAEIWLPTHAWASITTNLYPTIVNLLDTDQCHQWVQVVVKCPVRNNL